VRERGEQTFYGVPSAEKKARESWPAKTFEYFEMIMFLHGRVSVPPAFLVPITDLYIISVIV